MLPTILLHPSLGHSHYAPGCAGDMWGAEPLGLKGIFPQRPGSSVLGAAVHWVLVCVQGIRPGFRTGGPQLGDPVRLCLAGTAMNLGYQLSSYPTQCVLPACVLPRSSPQGESACHSPWGRVCSPVSASPSDTSSGLMQFPRPQRLVPGIHTHPPRPPRPSTASISRASWEPRRHCTWVVLQYSLVLRTVFSASLPPAHPRSTWGLTVGLPHPDGGRPFSDQLTFPKL